MNLRNLRLLFVVAHLWIVPLSADTPSDEMLRAVNAARAAHGLRPVTVNQRLNRAAAQHARDLARTGRFDHVGSDGSTVGERVERAGYEWSRVAENLERTRNASAAGVVRQWLASPGHRRNLLNPQLTEIGFARDGRIWVLVLARPARGAP